MVCCNGCGRDTSAIVLKLCPRCRGHAVPKGEARTSRNWAVVAEDLAEPDPDDNNPVPSDLVYHGSIT